MRPTVRVGLERVPGREHERDHGAGQVLLQRERGDHRDQRDQIHAWFAADESPDHVARDRDDADHRGRRPHEPGGTFLVEREREHAARSEPDDRQARATTGSGRAGRVIAIRAMRGGQDSNLQTEITRLGSPDPSRQVPVGDLQDSSYGHANRVTVGGSSGSFGLIAPVHSSSPEPLHALTRPNRIPPPS